MTTRVNRNLTGMVPKPQIVIEVNADGSSTMNVRGTLTMPAVLITLISQLNALAPKMVSEIFQLSRGVVNAQGTPVVSKPADNMEVTYPEDEQKALQDERAGKVQ